jgi:hypothetical protein
LLWWTATQLPHSEAAIIHNWLDAAMSGSRAGHFPRLPSETRTHRDPRATNQVASWSTTPSPATIPAAPGQACQPSRARVVIPDRRGPVSGGMPVRFAAIYRHARNAWLACFEPSMTAASPVALASWPFSRRPNSPHVLSDDHPDRADHPDHANGRGGGSGPRRDRLALQA